MKRPEKGDQITLNPVSGKNIHVITVEEIDEIRLGTEQKFKIKASVGRKNLHFIAREISQSYLEIWKILKDAGLPVIPLLRVCNDFPDLLKRTPTSMVAFIPDLTSNGSKLYGKSLALKSHLNEFAPTLQKDELFYVIMRDQYDAVVRFSNMIVQRATQKDILLPADSELGELVIHPNGTWEIIIVDIEFAGMKSKFQSKIELQNHNNRMQEHFFHYLQIIYSNLR